MALNIVASRELSREIAFISIYIFDISHQTISDLQSFDWYLDMVQFNNEDGLLEGIPKAYQKEIFDFSSLLLNGTISNLNRIDPVIEKFLVKWNFDRLHALDKAILRLSVYSLLYVFDIPTEVVIAEANELSNKYSDDNTSHYINGILHKIKEEYRRNFLLDYVVPKESGNTPSKKVKYILTKKKTGK